MVGMGLMVMSSNWLKLNSKSFVKVYSCSTTFPCTLRIKYMVTDKDCSDL